jgi:hypothetical protein
MAVTDRRGGVLSERREPERYDEAVKVWYGSHGGEGYVEVCFGEVWCGRKFAEDWTGCYWYGKMGFGSRGV